MEIEDRILGKWIVPWKSGDAKTITMIVTENCNLACRYCYLPGKNAGKAMPYAVATRCIDYFLSERTLFSEDSVIWEFSGGEPFLEIDLIDELCDYIKKRLYTENHPWFDSYRFSFSTNGLLYGTEKVQRFIEKNYRHLSIGFSVDGTKEKHDRQRVYPDGSGSYDDMMKNFPLWRSQFPGGYTKATLSHECLPYLKDSVIGLWNLGLRNVAMNTVYEDVWEEGDDLIFEHQLNELGGYILEHKLWDYNCLLFTETIGEPMSAEDNRNWCGSGKMIAVDCDGNFFPCNRFTGFSLSRQKPRIIGNCYTGVDTNKLRPFLVLDRYSQSSEECFACEVARGCAWCTGLNYDESQSGTIFHRTTHHCRMHKARVRSVRRFWKAYHEMKKDTIRV